MLTSVKELLNYRLRAVDGEIGRLADVYFDDREWTVRYLVADTGSWMSDNHVLISTYSVSPAEPSNQQFSVDLKRKQIEDSPVIDKNVPVSRQQEKSLSEHYNWPVYWLGVSRVGTPMSVPSYSEEQDMEASHLRSTKEVMTYHIRAMDGELGHVEDFLIDDDWNLRYMIVDTKNYWTGRKFVVAPDWIRTITWDGQMVHVGMQRQEITEAPEFRTGKPITKEFEEKLNDYYTKLSCWV
jgi:hypothetical protein